MLLRNGGLLREAVCAARMLASRTPSETHLRALGLLEMEIGSPLHARRAFEEAVLADPSSLAAHFSLGSCAAELGDWETALVEFSRATKSPKLAAAAFAKMGEAYVHTRRAYAAEGHFFSSLALCEKAETRVGLASAWAELGLEEQATQTLRAVLKGGTCDFLALYALMDYALGSAEERHVLSTQAWLKNRGHAGLRALRARAVDESAHELGESMRSPFRRLLRTWDLSAAEIEVLKRLSPVVASHRSMVPTSSSEATAGGSYSGDLFSEPEVDLEELYEMIAAAVFNYTQELLLVSREHLLVRSRPPNVRVHAWAVKLKDGEHQAVHFHPDAWLSGCLYLQVPECIDEHSIAGHLAFGQSGAGLFSTVCPQVGRIVVFPSCLDHFTLPQVGSGVRLSLGFDVLAVH